MKIRINKLSNNKVSIKFDYNINIINKIRSINGRTWNPKKKLWIIPFHENIIDNLKEIFKEYNLHIDKTFYLSDLDKELKINIYSKNTISNYMSYNKHLLEHSNKLPNEIENKDIKDFLYYLINIKNAGASMINCAINGIKFYYGRILKKPFVYEITRPKKDRKLPIVFNFKEIDGLLSAPKNLKHKTILTLIYSAGLRVEETSKIKIQDIDIERKLINIYGKGRKSRYSILSDFFLKLLDNYLREFNPSYWLFEGQYPNTHISTRTIQKIFENAKNKAGITKKGNVHLLRHSFSTHLLENGVDIRIIQELLGHSSPKTTMIYTHVAKKTLINLKSPLDTLKEKKKDKLN